MLNMLPTETEDTLLSNSSLVSEHLTTFLKESRYGTDETEQKKRKKRLKIPAGKSIKGKDLIISEYEDDPEELNIPDTPDNELTDNEGVEIHQSSSSDIVQVGQMPVNILKDNIEEGSWVVVNYGKKIPKLYFGKVTKIIKKGLLYEGSFTRPSKFSSSDHNEVHVFPDVIDFCNFKLEEVIRIVSSPKSLRRGRLEFSVRLDDVFKTLCRQND